MKRLLLLTLVACTAVLAGCASLQSSYLDNSRDGGGLVYFMPKKDLIIEIGVIESNVKMKTYLSQKAAWEGERTKLINQSLPWPDPKLRKVMTDRIDAINVALSGLKRPTTSELKANSIGISLTDSFPDTNLAFSLHSAFNPTSKNTVDVTISDKGLLSGATSKTESQLSQVLVNLASSAGALAGAGISKFSLPGAAAPLVDDCPSKGNNRFLRDFSDFVFTGNTHDFDITCAGTTFTVTVEKLWLDGLRNGPFVQCSTNKEKLCVSGNETANDVNKSGLFFRQPMPIQIKVTDAGSDRLLTDKIVYSPSLSPVHLLPIRKTLFADNEATFTFVDGVPTKYKQESGGEFVSLLKLPADVIAAYFAAVGETFSAISKTDTSEATALQDSLKLQLAREKYNACTNAIAESNKEAIDTLKCAD